MQARAKARKAQPKPDTSSFQRRLAQQEARMLEDYIRHPSSIVHYHDIPASRIKAEKASPLRTPKTITEGVLLPVGTGKPLHCSQNVLARLREDKKLSYVLGVIKYQNRNNAEHTHYEGHVVLKHPDGTLEDVTGRLDNETHINFIPLWKPNNNTLIL